MRKGKMLQLYFKLHVNAWTNFLQSNSLTDSASSSSSSSSSSSFLFSKKIKRLSMTKPKSRLNEAKKKMEEILKKAESQGCSLGGLLCLPSSKKLLEKQEKASGNSYARKWHWAAVVGLAFAFIFVVDARPVHEFFKFWLKWKYGNSRDLCFLTMPDEMVKIFRPPVPCSICQGITQIDKVSNISADIFEQRYAYTGRPVVVTDGMSNWTAQHVFGFEFFRKIYRQRMDRWKLHNCQFFPYNTDFRDLEEVFNMSDERAFMAKGSSPWYVGWSNCDDEINQILRRHYEKPYFLPTTAETKRLDWIFMGSTGYGAPMHVDNVEHPSWQAQLRGRKKWSLSPPPECFYFCENLQVVVEPGEIIVLDTNQWYHSTLIVSKEISVTIGAEYD